MEQRVNELVKVCPGANDEYIPKHLIIQNIRDPHREQWSTTQPVTFGAIKSREVGWFGGNDWQGKDIKCIISMNGEQVAFCTVNTFKLGEHAFNRLWQPSTPTEENRKGQYAPIFLEQCPIVSVWLAPGLEFMMQFKCNLANINAAPILNAQHNRIAPLCGAIALRPNEAETGLVNGVVLRDVPNHADIFDQSFVAVRFDSSEFKQSEDFMVRIECGAFEFNGPSLD